MLIVKFMRKITNDHEIFSCEKKGKAEKLIEKKNACIVVQVPDFLHFNYFAGKI